MFKINEIKELIRALDKSSLTELTIKGENKTELKLKKSPYVVAAEIPREEGQQVVVQQVEPQAVAQPPVQKPAAEEKAEGPKEKVEEAIETKSDDANLHKIVSPMVGTFYAAPAPDADPYVKVGDKVEEDTVVCIIEAMKLFNELEAEVKGEIVEILVENGQLVEYGQPLFLVKTE